MGFMAHQIHLDRPVASLFMDGKGPGPRIVIGAVFRVRYRTAVDGVAFDGHDQVALSAVPFTGSRVEPVDDILVWSGLSRCRHRSRCLRFCCRRFRRSRIFCKADG